MDREEVIQRLTRVEEKLDAQNEDIKELKRTIDKLFQSLNERAKANGAQDVSIAQLDQRLAHMEVQVRQWGMRIWSAFGIAIGALVEVVIQWFLMK